MRSASIERKTRETEIKITIGLDGTGKYDIDTGIGFLNHMLESFAKHGSLMLQVDADTDKSDSTPLRAQTGNVARGAST